MWQAIARIKGSEQWRQVGNMGQPFAADKGILELMVALMVERYPNIEYKIVEANNMPPAHGFSYQGFSF